MGNKTCPKCKKNILMTGRVFRKCKECGYKERKGKTPMYKESKYEKKSITSLMDPTSKEEIIKIKGKIPELEEEKPRKKFILSKATEKEMEMLWERNEQLRKIRKQISIERLLKQVRKNKYSGLRGKKINMEGELYEV